MIYALLLSTTQLISDFFILCLETRLLFSPSISLTHLVTQGTHSHCLWLLLGVSANQS